MAEMQRLIDLGKSKTVSEKQPKGFGKFDAPMKKLVKVPPSALAKPAKPKRRKKEVTGQTWVSQSSAW